MADFKSKLPDLKELGSMAGKLFKGVKSSVTEIVEDYKGKRKSDEAAQDTEKPASAEKKAEPKAKAEPPKAAPESPSTKESEVSEPTDEEKK